MKEEQKDFSEEITARQLGVEEIIFLHAAPMQAIPERTEREVVLLTWVVTGSWGVRDRFNNGATIFPGDLLRVTAGTGISITECNPSETDPARIVQLRLRPTQGGMISGYEVRNFFPEEMEPEPLLIASVSPQGNVVNACAAVDLHAVIVGPAAAHQLQPLPSQRLIIPVEKGVIVDGNTIEGTATLDAGKGLLLESQQQRSVVLIISKAQK